MRLFLYPQPRWIVEAKIDGKWEHWVQRKGLCNLAAARLAKRQMRLNIGRPSCWWTDVRIRLAL